MPNVSVVITCFNYGQYLEAAVRSVLDQTYRDVEVIVVDDGSTDNTPDIMRIYVSDDRVSYIRQENAGQPKAKNRGILASKGAFIAFLDADDLWMPEKLEKQMVLFDDPQVGVVYARRIWINQDGEIIPGNERRLWRGEVLDRIFIDNFVCFSSAVIRRAVLHQVGFFDESLPMGIDYDLWIRVAACATFDFVDEPLVRYRTGHANLSRNTLKRYDCAQRIMRKSLGTPAIRDRLRWYVPRLAWADTWSNMAVYFAAQGDRWKALRFFAKAFVMMPVYPQLFRRLLKCLLLC